MIEAHCLTDDRGGDRTAGPRPAPARDCRLIQEFLAGQALNALSPGVARAVSSHLAVCPACRDEHDCLATVAAHLTRVRDALAPTPGRRQRAYPSDQAGRRRTAPHGSRRRGPLQAAPATRLTLSEWVSRTTCMYAPVSSIPRARPDAV